MTAVARGELTQEIEIGVEGEISTLKQTVNSADLLSAFMSESTRVALEGGVQGIWGGQATGRTYCISPEGTPA